ncbi:hypothetical protein [Actinoplanes solisilvae]|uniref:hypothetical protein n=1 Tax=Actinoplanes solisilvae TaxID=2486853 RepID=UPI0013E2B330|nr:hypothetical protein [Actinoplanes solisilvae]
MTSIDFRLFWDGQTTSRTGSAITAVALPLVAIGPLGASALQARSGSSSRS